MKESPLVNVRGYVHLVKGREHLRKRCVKVKITQSCPTLCHTMDCSLPGSSVHEILQARILEWVAVPFSRGSSQPGGRTRVSRIAGRFFTSGATREEKNLEGKCPVHWGSRSSLSSCLFALHLCTPLNASNTTSLAFSALLSSPASSSLL